MLDDPWFIGIGGGIVAGLIVTVISRLLFSRKDQSEHLQRVAAANQEVVYAVRPGISEGVMPSVAVVSALSSATARKYRVKESELFSVEEVADELVKEVMDSSFLSARDKEEYCERLSAMAEEAAALHEREESLQASSGSYKAHMATAISAALGMATATMSAVATLLREGPIEILPKQLDQFVPIAMSLGAGLLTALFLTFARAANQRRNGVATGQSRAVLTRSARTTDREHSSGAHNPTARPEGDDAAG